jgi:hypothetical protein
MSAFAGVTMQKPLVFGVGGNISLAGFEAYREGTMAKRLLLLLLPMAFAGCSMGHVNLPMTLGPSDPAPATCLTYSGTPAYGDCKGPGTVSVPQTAR